MVGVEGSSVGAHRAAWYLETGKWAADNGKEVCHKCDNEKCVRVFHLFAGTHMQNMRDMTNKNRGNTPSGEQHGNSKLTELNVTGIRQGLSKGSSTEQLANKYKVSRSAIYRIKNGRTWKVAA
jgi:ribosome-binding protein aMBF1 (putative translation factor)